MRVLVVTPTYQEADNIAELIRRVRAAAPDVDLLVVDDNSPDGTAAIARAAGAELGHVDVTVREKKDGLGTAYRHGFQIGLDRGYDVLVEIDADLSHDPAAIPSLVRSIEDGADLCIGSRYVPGGSIPEWPWHRRALSRYGNLYASAVLGIKVRDATAGFRAYRATTLTAIEVWTTRSKGYGFQIENTYRVVRRGGSVAEVPIQFNDRVRGHSKLSAVVAVEELALVTWWGVRDRVLRRFSRRREPGAAGRA